MLSRVLIILGIILIIIGIGLPYFKKLGFGHFPGDILIKRGDVTFYFPITTCIIISIILSLIVWFFYK